MRRYEAKELSDKNGKPTGKWHFTQHHFGSIVPVGYCAGWPHYTQKDYERSPGLKEEMEKKAKFKKKYHKHGHDSREEAEACYKEYLIDNEMQVHKDSSTQRK